MPQKDIDDILKALDAFKSCTCSYTYHARAYLLNSLSTLKPYTVDEVVTKLKYPLVTYKDCGNL